MQTTPFILFGVVAWLLCMGATLFFVHVVWLSKLKKVNTKLQDDLATERKELDLLKKVVSDLRTDTTEKHLELETRHVSLNKTVVQQKEENNKMFETITEGFEFVNTERVVMIKDLAELKRRVRMNTNETKRQTFQRRNRENQRSV